jgi:hypothetical protein
MIRVKPTVRLTAFVHLRYSRSDVQRQPHADIRLMLRPEHTQVLLQHTRYDNMYAVLVLTNGVLGEGTPPG